MQVVNRGARPRGGCVRRALIFGIATILLGVCGLAASLAIAMRSPAGKYYVGVGLLVGGFDSTAEKVAADLVSQRPNDKAAYYALLATAQRRQNRGDAMRKTLEAAVAALPDSWDAHSDRCWYGALFDAAADVLDSCEVAVSSASDQRHRAIGNARHAVALALADSGSGSSSGGIDAARDAMHRAFDSWSEAGVNTDRLNLPWSTWRDALDAGRNPFDAETLRRERERF